MAAENERSSLGLSTAFHQSLLQRLRRYGISLVLVAGVTLFGRVAFSGLELANIAMIYLATVVISALWLGRGPALLAAVVGVGLFDFFFVPPHLTFSVTDVQYVLTFGVMLAVGLIVGTLAARSREQTSEARQREQRTAALYALSRELAAAQDVREVAAVAVRHAHDMFAADAILAAPIKAKAGTLDVLAFAGEPDWFDERERGVAQWAIEHVKAAGVGTGNLPASAGRYVPLVGTSGKVGLLALRPVGSSHAPSEAFILDPAALLLLEAFASQIASALERVTLSESQQAARFEAERERLRSALLSSVSHDLRTPLASITGAASTLEQAASATPQEASSLDPATRAALLRTIVSESTRLNDIIANLIFATRLESGAVVLKREWTTLEEIVGVGLARHRAELASRPFRVQLPSDLPMIRVDNAMMPQVISNLMENALRYTPAGTPVAISAWTTDTQLVVKVSDEGAGLAEDEAAKVFQRFYRGRASKTSATSTLSGASTGMGLGLTICEGIIRAHGGRIWAEQNIPRGVAFMFSLPIEQPQPVVVHEQPS
ncbi:MAG TPA: DUF4118 domain-containing protein, partial [Polyangiaceae bacterium]|nr:DUF4118 domain-containing protein [Polyangiaceae bacterium]